MAKKITFSDINESMKTYSTYGDTLDKSNISSIDSYIYSGNYHLNAALTGSLFKGYPNNRTVSLCGPSGTGKTFLILNAIKNAINDGYSIIFYDSEIAVDRDLMEKFGIDVSQVRYEPCKSVQEFRSSIANLTDDLIQKKDKGYDLPKIMVVLDSAGNLATEKEVEDAKSHSDKADMTRAKILKSTFRIIMTRLGLCKIPFIFSNHTYQTQDLFSKTIQGGGTGPEYSASIILFLNKAKLKEDSDPKKQTGIIVTANTNKNRFVKPTTIKFHIAYDKGMNPYVGLTEYISWDLCGIQKGKFIKEGEYNKLSEEQKESCRLHETDGSKQWFMPSDTARKFCVKHLNDTVNISELHSSKVFTEEVLRKIDEECIANKFQYSDSSNNLDFIFDSIDEPEE